MSKFTKKDGHPRFAHFAIFVFLIMATTFGLTKIGNYSLPDALAQTSGLTHYWNMDTEVPVGNPETYKYFPDSVGGLKAINEYYIPINTYDNIFMVPNSVMQNPNNKGGSAKFTFPPYSAGFLRLDHAQNPLSDLQSIAPPWTFTAWVKLIARSQVNGVYGTTDAPIFASLNTFDYCGLQIMISNATSSLVLTPTYNLVFDVMACVGDGTPPYNIGPAYRKSVTSKTPVPHGNFGTGLQSLTDETSPWVYIGVVVKGPPSDTSKNVVLYMSDISGNVTDVTGNVDGTATIPSLAFPGPAFPTRLSVPTATLGWRESGSGGNFNGYMDDVKIYNRALTSCEIKAQAGAFCTNSLGVKGAGNGRCEQSCGENFLNCWADCKPKIFRDF